MEIGNGRISYTVLKIHHDIIVQDIQGDVIWALRENQVLTESEYVEIKSLENRKEEACSLLELLPLKGSFGINQFINYLSVHYSWIADPILNAIKIELDGSLTAKMMHTLTTGEVPQLSSRHVSRTDHVVKLKNVLIELEAGHFVVVHGMTGCGKSSLVVDVLNDSKISLEYLKGFVLWINVGREHSLDVGHIQTEILNRLNDQEQLISPPINTELDYEATRKKLQKLWKKKKLTGGLLVLDDVYSNQIIKYLDIGCKILITTHDTCIMNGIVDTRVKYLKVNEGFEENETLDLFSKCLGVNRSSLPIHASNLHILCKGFPLTISLIGAQLETHKEEVLINSSRWHYYLKALLDKTSETFKYSELSDKQKSLKKTIEMCIKSLPDDLQKNYHDFAVFVHDLNIKPEVLSVLWNFKKVHVEDLMLKLMHKNLVVRVWNQPLNSYVYSIHDLLLSNLKETITHEELKELHVKLIERYRTTCNGNFAELPKNDNYIFLYFGYHLKNAGLLEEFPRWYLDLKFLESKIFVTGPADLLADLKKYRKYIAVQGIYEKHIKEIEHFVAGHGPNLYQTKCDIVQLGLQEPETSFIYVESCKIAKANGNSYFYYDIRPFQNYLPKPHISVVRDNIETATFGKRHDEILIGTDSGSIKVWNVITHTCLYTSNGHTARVTHLAKNKLKTLFLSTSDDSTIRIWNLNSILDSESNGSETRTPSPETRQEHWQNPFTKSDTKPFYDCLYVLRDDVEPVSRALFFSKDRVIVSSSDKTLKIWKLDSGINKSKFMSIKQNNKIGNICFAENEKYSDLILFSTHSRGKNVIYGCQWPFEHCTGLIYLKEDLLSFMFLPGIGEKDKLLVLTSTKVNLYPFEWDKSFSMDHPQSVISYKHAVLTSVSEISTNLVNKSKYIAFSLSNCTIQICELSSGFNFLELNDPIQGTLNLDWFWSNTDQCNWLCASSNKSIKLWRLNDIALHTSANRINSTQQFSSYLKDKCKNEILSFQDYKVYSEQNLYCYKLTQHFDAVWLDNNSILVAAVSQCGSLKILLEGLDKWSIIDKTVSAIKIVHSDRKVDQIIIIVAFDDLSVHILKYETSEYLFDCMDKANQIFGCFDGCQVTTVMVHNRFSKSNDNCDQILEIWTKSSKYKIPIKHFIDCYVFHDKIIVLHNHNELMIVYLKAGYTNIKKLEMNNIEVRGRLMIDDSNLAVTHLGSSLKLYKLTFDKETYLIDEYQLPFENTESIISMSLSNNKKLIVVGQKNIALIDKIFKTTKHFTIDPSVNSIHSMTWSSDDTHLAIKTDNQIIIIDAESGKKIANIRVAASKFTANSTLTKFITVNTAGKLLVLKLSSHLNSSNYAFI